MSAVIKQIIDSEENKVYPITKASATYMASGTETVQQAIELMKDGSHTITFPSTEQIIDTLDNGYIITTTFNNDGTINEITKDENGMVLVDKKTTFNSDGSIRIEVQ